MRRAQRTRNRKKIKRVTPGGRNVIHFGKKKHGQHVCGNCGAKLNRIALKVNELRKMCKSSKRPERKYPELCAKCSRLKLKSRVR